MSLSELLLLLFAAAVVSMLCRRLKLPYTVGLTLAGLGIALLPNAPQILLTKDLIFSALLPPLIFEAAFQLEWDRLRKDFAVIGSLAVLGVLISVAVVGAGVVAFLRWPVASAMVLAVLISATDPVSVIATFRELRVTGRVQLLTEAESLFNDGTAAVLFSIALVAVNNGALTADLVMTQFVVSFAGAVLIGLLIAGVALLLVGRTRDHLVEVTFTSLAAYGSFLLADCLSFSGVLATITAGIVLGNFGSQRMFSEKGPEVIELFWEYVAFVANSLVFLLIGLRVTHHSLGQIWLSILCVIILCLVGRAAAVYGTCACFVRSRHRVEWRDQHVLVWGGLRGALGLALALSLPEPTLYREQIVSITFGVVAFSVFAQGLTVPALLTRLSIVAAKRNEADG